MNGYDYVNEHGWPRRPRSWPRPKQTIDCSALPIDASLQATFSWRCDNYGAWVGTLRIGTVEATIDVHSLWSEKEISHCLKALLRDVLLKAFEHAIVTEENL